MADLTKIVQEAQKEVERIEIKEDVKVSGSVLAKDFIQLVKLVFGDEYLAASKRFFGPICVGVDCEDAFFSPSTGDDYTILYSGRERKTIFLKRKKVAYFQAVEFSRAVTLDNYADLRIRVYAPAAMEKARIFAVAYEKVSGKKAEVVRAYQKNEDFERLIPEVKAAKKRLNPEITPEDVKNFGVADGDRAVKAFDRSDDSVPAGSSEVVETEKEQYDKSYHHPIRPWMW